VNVAITAPRPVKLLLPQGGAAGGRSQGEWTGQARRARLLSEARVTPWASCAPLSARRRWPSGGGSLRLCPS